jgi:hypothetical protein
MKKRLVIAFCVFLLVSCNNKETTSSDDKNDDKTLCECVELDEKGVWDGQLSEGCIQIYLTKFGNDMEQMHLWFLDNCPAYQLKKQKQKLVI